MTGPRAETDDFEVLMGPGDEKEYTRQADELIMEFTKEGVKGKALGQGMMVTVPMGKVFVLGVELPYGFPVRRPVVRLVEPDPKGVTHECVDGESGVVTHRALAGWVPPQPLASVVRKIYADFSQNPPRAKAAKINWGLSSSTISIRDEVKVTHAPLVASGDGKVAEAPPMMRMPPSLIVPSEVKVKPVMAPSNPPSAPAAYKREEAKDRIQFPPIVRRDLPAVPKNFGLESVSVGDLQEMAGNDTRLRKQVEGYQIQLDWVVNGVRERGKEIDRVVEEKKEEVVLAKTRVEDMECKLAALKEELLVAKMCREDIMTAIASNAYVKSLRMTLDEHQANLQAVEAEYDRTRSTDYLDSIYYPIAYDYHVANIKYNQVQQALDAPLAC